MAEFFQSVPKLTNQYDSDRLLRSYLQRVLPADMLKEIERGLSRLGERAVTDILDLGNEAESFPPRHVPYDAWGRRIDRIEVCAAWKQLERIAAEEAIVATAYERRHGVFSRIHQFARLYLYGPSSAIATCPLAMADGAARVIELSGDEWLRANPLQRLISTDPARFWTSGQWMTERSGGSDVSGTSTVARRDKGGYRLHGTKWFTSATTAPMALTLARIEGAPEGSKGLSLFYVELLDATGQLQNILVHRLKDKLGTRALPTAELTLQGTPARLVGPEGQGVRKISPLLNITRAYNACCAVGLIRRGLALARSYAYERRVFGKLLCDQPLHVATLASMQNEFEAGFLITFRVAELLGREEVGQAKDGERAVLRLLTPLAKLYTARQAIACASETLEAFGGPGYVEDTGLPRLLRDAQVLSIWEGTTNVLSLDVLRALEKDSAFEPFQADVLERLGRIQYADLKPLGEKVQRMLTPLAEYLRAGLGEGPDYLQVGAREFAFAMARTYMASVLLEHADWMIRVKNDDRGIHSSRRWCTEKLAPYTPPEKSVYEAARRVALDQEERAS
jgi:alkylation response protein AidB-like acyl-CoA dehydrogenase